MEPFISRYSTGRARSPIRMGLLAAAVLTLLMGLGVVVWGMLWGNSASQTAVAQASVVVGTFVTLYVLFIGAFGTLAGFVAQSKASTAAKVFGLTVMIETVGIDLYRVWDSTTDLFIDATTGLSFFTLNDDVHDFFRYFLINVVAATVGVVVACIPSDRRVGRRPSQ